LAAARRGAPTQSPAPSSPTRRPPRNHARSFPEINIFEPVRFNPDRQHHSFHGDSQSQRQKFVKSFQIGAIAADDRFSERQLIGAKRFFVFLIIADIFFDLLGEINQSGQQRFKKLFPLPVIIAPWRRIQIGGRSNSAIGF